jgi:hypothetical protein
MEAKIIDLEKHYLIEQLRAVSLQTEHIGVKKVVDKAIEFINRQ